MNGMLFPHTYLSEETAAALAVCFDRLHILNTGAFELPEHMRRLVENGFLHRFAPVTGGEPEIENACREYEAWVAEHPGVHRNVAAFQTHASSLQGDSSPRGIRSEIRKGASRAAPDDDRARLFNARLFLSIAHLHDIRQETVARDMRGFLSGHRRFLASLKENGETEVVLPDIGEDARRAWDFMIPERLTAWAALAAANPPDTALFLTCRRSVFDEVRERIPGGTPLFSCRIGPRAGQASRDMDAWRLRFMESLNAIVAAADRETAGPPSSPPEQAVSPDGPVSALEIVLFSGLSPNRFIAGLARGKDRDAESSGRGTTGYRHTLAGLLDQP